MMHHHFHYIYAHSDDCFPTGAFSCMPSSQWTACYQQLDSALSIMRKEKDCYFPFLVPEEDEDEPEGEVSLLRPDADAPKDAKARMSTAMIWISFVGRLDDELTKALQLTDVHAEVGGCYDGRGS